MKSLMVGLLVVAALVLTPTTPVTANQAVVIGYVDLPAENAVVAANVAFHGWAVNLRTGRHPASLSLWRTNTVTHTSEYVPSKAYWGPRPDVQAYAQALGAPYPEVALGFAVVPDSPQPAGTWQYDLLVTDLQANPDSLNWTAHLQRRVIVQ